MAGKRPVTEEQNCETQAEYHRIFWLLHIFTSDMGDMPCCLIDGRDFPVGLDVQGGLSRADRTKGEEQRQRAGALQVGDTAVGREKSLLAGSWGRSAVRQPELAGGARQGHGHGCTLSGDGQQILSINADLPC